MKMLIRHCPRLFQYSSFGSQMTHWEIVATFIITTELVKISKNLQSDPAASAIISKYLQKFKLLKVIDHTY